MELARADLPTNPVGGAAAEIHAGGAAIERRGRRARGGDVARRVKDLPVQTRLEEPFQFRQLLAGQLLDEHAERERGNPRHGPRSARERRHVQLSPE
jgi:hypothetical protein